MTIEELITIIHNSTNNTIINYLSKHMLFMYPNRQANSFTQDEKIHKARQALELCIAIIRKDWNTSACLVVMVVPWLKGTLVGAEALNIKQNRKEHEMIKDFALDITIALQEILKGDKAVHIRDLKVYQQ